MFYALHRDDIQGAPGSRASRGVICFLFSKLSNMGWESLRRIAPADDFEILEAFGEVICSACHCSFQNKPGLADKPRGRCKCGGWICPTCLACQEMKDEAAGRRAPCQNQRRRVATRLAVQKKLARL